jgi:hypothetical protein
VVHVVAFSGFGLGETFIFSDKRAQGCAHSAGTFETGKEAEEGFEEAMHKEGWSFSFSSPRLSSVHDICS